MSLKLAKFFSKYSELPTVPKPYRPATPDVPNTPVRAISDIIPAQTSVYPREEVPITEVAATPEYSKDEVVAMITKAANEHGIEPELAIALATRESGLNPAAVNKKAMKANPVTADVGLFQIAGSNRTNNVLKRDITPDSPVADNISVGMDILKSNLKMAKRYYPNLTKEEQYLIASKAYNSGFGRHQPQDKWSVERRAKHKVWEKKWKKHNDNHGDAVMKLRAGLLKIAKTA